MNTTMKRTVLGSAALLLSGIAAFSAGPAGAAQATSEDGRLTGPYVARNSSADGLSSSVFAIVDAPAAGALGQQQGFPSVAAAVKQTAQLTYPSIGDSGPVRGVGDRSGVCLQDNGTNKDVTWQTCDGSQAQAWTWKYYDGATNTGVQGYVLYNPAVSGGFLLDRRGGYTDGRMAMLQPGKATDIVATSVLGAAS